MLLKYFYDKKLAHASYMVGCQRSKEAVIVDPGRDVEQYVSAAKSEGVEIVAVAETHIHADYVSGARELADRLGAKLYMSDEGPDEWKYQFLDEYPHEALHDGDSFKIGLVKFEVMHTPGHTPESISFVLTDEGGGADSPMGIFTGDFVFVGSIGRPDLLEEAAGLADTAEPGARDLFKSAERFKELPDHLQVWPAHGAGSACGKGLGAIPSSTVGYEKLFNPALQFTDENEFVEYILDDQPEAPKYFAVMKRVNKEGPAIIGQSYTTCDCDIDQLEKAIETGTVIDLIAQSEFGKHHVPGTINLPNNMLATWAGWILDYDKPVYLIGEDNESSPADMQEAIRVLQKIGIDEIAGVFKRNELVQENKTTESYASETPEELSESIQSGQVQLIDVRSKAEWRDGHIPEAQHRFLGKIPGNFDGLDKDKRVATQCRSGARSAIAASLLQAEGYEVVNLTGGFTAWQKAGLPVSEADEAACGQSCSV
ncbi:MBL fold metallo-hydrolase [Stieleria sp. JC731]|uniref:MBL fold metallo-hydrolase n=1 Tax=Pirellulaceae TaxID=2691357 RepID=UPI001E4E44CB|nr:MBL fold metallo-hydrolase [Stieleria sp. JC731]MCC9603220.1 MBL fold metallo-hydrolase [Stieleria sp. JC731]